MDANGAAVRATRPWVRAGDTTAEGAGVALRALRRVTRAKWDDAMVAPEKLVEAVVAEMEQCEMKHARRERSLS